EADDAAMQRHALPGHADVAARHAAVAHQPRGDEDGGVDADGETDALRPHDHRGIDADDVAARVDQRPSGVAGIERRVGLDDVLDQAPALGAHGAPQRADYAGGDGGLEAERVADGDDQLAGLDG